MQFYTFFLAGPGSYQKNMKKTLTLVSAIKYL